jgi:uncharacterized membrane protein (UPF0127 family)
MKSLSFVGDGPHPRALWLGARLLMRRAVIATAALGLLLVVVARPVAAAEFQNLEIVTKNGVYPFAVELAVTPEEHERGLMFRKELPDGRGMLFDFKAEQPVEFWMHNTYISLDIIFIRGDGRILRIAENATPLSDKHIPSGGPIRGVLEVIGGTAKKLGIAAGDRVAHPIFGSR